MAQYRPKSIEELLSGSSSGAGAGTGLLSALRSYSSIVDSFARRDYYSTLAEDKSEKYAMDKIDDMLTQSKEARNVNNPDFWDTVASGVQSMENVTLTDNLEQKIRYTSGLVRDARTKIALTDKFRTTIRHHTSPGGALTLDYNFGTNEDGTSKLLDGDKTDEYNLGGVPTILQWTREQMNLLEDTGYVDAVTRDIYKDVIIRGENLRTLGFQDGVIQDKGPLRAWIEKEWQSYEYSTGTGSPYRVKAENITGTIESSAAAHERLINATESHHRAQANRVAVDRMAYKDHLNQEGEMSLDKPGYEKKKGDLWAKLEESNKVLEKLNLQLDGYKEQRDLFFPMLSTELKSEGWKDWLDVTYAAPQKDIDEMHSMWDKIDITEKGGEGLAKDQMSDAEWDAWSEGGLNAPELAGPPGIAHPSSFKPDEVPVYDDEDFSIIDDTGVNPDNYIFDDEHQTFRHKVTKDLVDHKTPLHNELLTARDRKESPTFEYMGKTYSQEDVIPKDFENKKNVVNKIENMKTTIADLEAKIKKGIQVEYNTGRIESYRKEIESKLGNPI